MAYAAHHRDLVPYFCGKASATKSNAEANKAGVLRRIFDAISEPRQKQADRDIARLLAGSGGRLTDDMESAGAMTDALAHCTTCTTQRRRPTPVFIPTSAR